eukprot:CAMPEP_0181107548 /NCGR_PEP_ID=MMETSP1071-20121207/17145_1 /TAXON_ID=35127 /ORGANISM="Thalassiosira sp., Strain NH16" /LENGTH=306 /DNA_ID=CAMNT_0023191071 /DNA_START=77 /DNA_END=997 /DNA_ORIENTATION=-
MKNQCLQACCILLLLCDISPLVSSLSLSANKIRALSLDVTGTLLVTKEPVIKSYHNAAVWARLPDCPSQDELKNGFKVAFRERCIESPCFGGVEGISGREWWRATVARVLHHARPGGVSCTEQEFDRYFRRVYQHFGSPAGYAVLEDAQDMLTTLRKKSETATSSFASEDGILLGITSNTPTRHMESVLPMLDCLHEQFSWFVCSQDVGHEKPSPEIFDASYRRARFWMPDLRKEEVLHIGDSYACDYCGARQYGFQALLLDRSENPAVTAYQDWMEAPEYEGKSLEDVQENTITSLKDVVALLSD